MSFSADVKKELCAIDAPESCCRKAQAYGMLLFGKTFGAHSMTLQTENSMAAQQTAQLLAGTAGVVVDVVRPMSRRNAAQSGVYTVTVQSGEARARALSYFGHGPKETGVRINLANLEKECCVAAFLRGVFLSCGTVTDPAKGYRLEFTVAHKNLSESLLQFFSQISEFSVQPKLVQRKGAYVVYMKNSEEITDLLTFMGAVQGAMEYIQAKMFKEVRNDANRRTNFDTANIDKTVTAAARQAEAIRWLIQKDELSCLPEELQEIALLRLENPEMSLRELGENMREPISRSGVNHRLQKLMEIAEELSSGKGGAPQKM